MNLNSSIGALTWLFFMSAAIFLAVLAVKRRVATAAKGFMLAMCLAYAIPLFYQSEFEPLINPNGRAFYKALGGFTAALFGLLALGILRTPAGLMAGVVLGFFFSLFTTRLFHLPVWAGGVLTAVFVAALSTLPPDFLRNRGSGESEGGGGDTN